MSTRTSTDLFNRLGQAERIRQVAAYDLFQPSLRPRLDALATRTAERLHTPIAMISVLLDSAQFLLGQHGLPAWVSQVEGIPAEWSLCARTVLAGQPYCVGDIPVDATHADNPMLVRSGLRSYAGVPLIDDNGYVLGAHCVLDTTPRVFTDHEILPLAEYAGETMQILADYRTG